VIVALRYAQPSPSCDKWLTQQADLAALATRALSDLLANGLVWLQASFCISCLLESEVPVRGGQYLVTASHAATCTATPLRQPLHTPADTACER
jgi:hypothetical protein